MLPDKRKTSETQLPREEFSMPKGNKTTQLEVGLQKKEQQKLKFLVTNSKPSTKDHKD